MVARKCRKAILYSCTAHRIAPNDRYLSRMGSDPRRPGYKWELASSQTGSALQHQGNARRVGCLVPIRARAIELGSPDPVRQQNGGLLPSEGRRNQVTGSSDLDSKSSEGGRSTQHNPVRTLPPGMLQRHCRLPVSTPENFPNGISYPKQHQLSSNGGAFLT